MNILWSGSFITAHQLISRGTSLFYNRAPTIVTPVTLHSTHTTITTVTHYYSPLLTTTLLSLLHSTSTDYYY